MKINIEAKLNETKELAAILKLRKTLGSIGELTIKIISDDGSDMQLQPVEEQLVVPQARQGKKGKKWSEEVKRKIGRGVRRAARKRKFQEEYVQEEYDGKLDIRTEETERTPHKFKKSTGKKPHIRQTPSTLRHWSKEEKQRLREFYMNPVNHYYSGEVLSEKLKEFSKTIDRTSMAVSLHIINMRLNRTLVRGTIHRNINRTFPQFKTLRDVPVQLLQSLFKHITLGRRGVDRVLTFSHAASIGIDDIKIWNAFLQEVLQNANRIALNLRIKNKFRVEGSGSQMILIYG